MGDNIPSDPTPCTFSHVYQGKDTYWRSWTEAKSTTNRHIRKNKAKKKNKTHLNHKNAGNSSEEACYPFTVTSVIAPGTSIDQ